MKNRIPLVTTKLSNITHKFIEDQIPLDSVIIGSELDILVSKISKPFKLYKIYEKDTFGYYAEFENEQDALEYALRLNPTHIHHG
jgi:hypothetical protein